MLSNILEIYKGNKAIRVFLQLMLIVMVYFSVRYWKSLDAIQGAAPVIVAQTLQGDEFDLREHRERPMLVHFWATWCPVCELENSNVASIAGDYQVITLASWSEGVEQVKDYLQQENLSMPVIVDEDGEWAKVYGVKGVPASFFIDTNGDIQLIESGYTTELGFRLRMWWLEKT